MSIESTNDEIWANPPEPDLERDVAVLVAFALYYMSARRDEVAEQLDRLKLLLDETFDSVLCKDNVRRPLSEALRGEMGLDPPSAVEAVRAVLRRYVYGDKAYVVSYDDYGSAGPPSAVFQTAELAESWAELLGGSRTGGRFNVDEFQLLPAHPEYVQIWCHEQTIYALPDGVIFTPQAERMHDPQIGMTWYWIEQKDNDAGSFHHWAPAPHGQGRINVAVSSTYSSATKHDPAAIPAGMRPVNNPGYAPGVKLAVQGADLETVRQVFDDESAKLAELLDRLAAQGFAGSTSDRHNERRDL